MKSEVYKIKVDTPDELLARILDVAVSIRNSEDQLTRTTRDLRTGVAKRTEVYGGNFENLCAVTNLSLLSKKFVI